MRWTIGPGSSPMPIAVLTLIERFFGALLIIGALVCLLVAVVGPQRWERERTKIRT